MCHKVFGLLTKDVISIFKSVYIIETLQPC